MKNLLPYVLGGTVALLIVGVVASAKASEQAPTPPPPTPPPPTPLPSPPPQVTPQIVIPSPPTLPTDVLPTTPPSPPSPPSTPPTEPPFVPTGVFLYKIGHILMVPVTSISVLPSTLLSPEIAAIGNSLRMMSAVPGATITVRVTEPAIINMTGSTVVKANVMSAESPVGPGIAVPSGLDVPVTLNLEQPVKPLGGF